VRRRAILVAAALLAAGALAGTARGDFGDPKKQHTAADMALARGILPKLSDLPAGWKATRSTDSSTNDNSFSCAGFKPDLSDLVETGYAESPDLSMGDQNLVSGFAAVFRTAGDATQAYARVIRPALARCLRTLFEKESTKTLKVKVLSVRQARVTDVNAHAEAFRIVARFSGSGLRFPAHIDFVFFRSGRAVAGTLLLHFPQAVDPKLEARLLAAIDGRIASA
jgi:hypothetical protein